MCILNLVTIVLKDFQTSVFLDCHTFFAFLCCRSGPVASFPAEVKSDLLQKDGKTEVHGSSLNKLQLGQMPFMPSELIQR